MNKKKHKYNNFKMKISKINIFSDLNEKIK